MYFMLESDNPGVLFWDVVLGCLGLFIEVSGFDYWSEVVMMQIVCSIIVCNIKYNFGYGNLRALPMDHLQTVFVCKHNQ